METINKNNIVNVLGVVASIPEFSHEVFGEGFYIFMLDIPRLSGCIDKIPITVSERLLDVDRLSIGIVLQIEGQFRSYNNYDTNGNKLLLTVFAREFKLIPEDFKSDPNRIYLNGFVCKKPMYRTTPLGREITDVLLAVNRAYNRSDYIPVVMWGRNAKFADTLKVGDPLTVKGRIQSRHYRKKLQNGDVLDKTAYEVSVCLGK